MNRVITAVALAVPALVLACASAAEPKVAAPAPLDVLRAGGTFGFVLAESDPGAKAKASCASEHPSDAAGADACYGAIAAEAAREGIRFSVDGAGRLVWTSYCAENGKDVTCLEGALDAAPETDRTVSAHFVEIPHGVQFPKLDHVPTQALRFEVVDGDTVVMVDPDKGRLVFRRINKS
jgi:hypothetical protein